MNFIQPQRSVIKTSTLVIYLNPLHPPSHPHLSLDRHPLALHPHLTVLSILPSFSSHVVISFVDARKLTDMLIHMLRHSYPNPPLPMPLEFSQPIRHLRHHIPNPHSACQH
ncbi:unnamed protein product [Protopolystoma xenopodis]|uniref:Uncharacterized protein n=1 Tax=Protopolystoma xenopodis TaxID=117903 RepID=A0A448WDL8_9PLAT|nr:unnamed protein product [Protopolystoma xenopodis]